MEGQEAPAGRHALEHWVLACAAGVIYYVLAGAGMRFSNGLENAAPLWPAAGFGVAAALLWGPRAAVGVLLGACLGAQRPPLGDALPWAAAGAALAGLGAAAQAVLGAALLRRFGSPEALPRSAREAAVFCALAPAIAAIAPAFALAALAAAGAPPGFQWKLAGQAWWAADTAGLLVVVPLILAWRQPAERLHPTPARAAEALAAAAVLAFGAAMGFAVQTQPLLFVSFPAVCWLLFRFGSRAATAAVAGIAAAAGWLSAGGTVESSVYTYSAYLVALAATAVLARALLHERQSALDALAEDARAARRRVEMDRRTFEHLPTGLAILSLPAAGDLEALRIVDINPAGLRLAGAHPDGERFEGAPLRDVLPALFATELPEACVEVLRRRRGGAEASRFATMRLDGSQFDLVIFALSETEVAAVYQDVTERKKAQSLLQESASLLLLMVESVRDYAIFRLDPEGKVASWSRGAEVIYGLDAAAALGRPYRRFLLPESEAEAAQDRLLAEAGREGRAQAEGWCRRKDGDKFWADAVLTALRDEAGGLLGFVAVVRDATRRRKAEIALADQSAALARSNVELTQFAYVASHDLNAPLHKVKAFGDRLRQKVEKTLDDESRDYLQRMMRAVDGMQQLIDGLLALARVTTRGGAPAQVNLNVLAKDVVEGLDLSASRPAAKVEIGPLPTIHADPVQMRQLLQNLVANALKFQRPGAKPVVRIHGRATGGGLCELVVADNGIGIDMKYAERIFEPFQRLNSAFDYEGSGIGLAICRKIVSRHGGSITVSSKPDHGAEFKVVLPITQEGRLVWQSPEKASR